MGRRNKAGIYGAGTNKKGEDVRLSVADRLNNEMEKQIRNLWGRKDIRLYQRDERTEKDKGLLGNLNREDKRSLNFKNQAWVSCNPTVMSGDKDYGKPVVHYKGKKKRCS